MNTQNVNVKTATKESTERWVENLLATAISEQKSLLLHLVELKSKRMRESERSELVWGALMRMADNVLGAGVVDWHADVLKVHFDVAQPWLQSRKLVELLYGDTGKDAWNDARKYIADSMRAEPYMP
ncbi:TPA: hypothetical protein MDQ61_005433 [Klebsiella pneumoniae]|uniref:hypothetical protein n=1 Tax=Enterobacteriaceae TaxID=543 RepID=UPI00043194B6|nr:MULTISPECIES: hypothetical protein [Enterobacteriaceae]HBN2758430.1 hypothetical protein [Escherichia coli O25b:H4-ST131]HBR1313667.1 hypothetical protein [Klebsiella quasipneumoniae subsp. quasipneumoniae]HEM8800404.1 hypothetical protein [Klebsiella michiganensis]KDL66099.1 hypothetical protein AD97_05056 [Klebsiella pneumoniae MGH 71]MBZ1763564.1 hypothetical protein [Klebsiella pneumoniae]